MLKKESTKSKINAGWAFILTACLLLGACDNYPWNDPYPRSEATANIRYSSFAASPKTLDPARSYSTDESIFLAQIYEPPLQYHFLKRPYILVPLTAANMPKVTYLDASGKEVSEDDKAIAYTRYDIELKPGIYYQPHPAFARDKAGRYYYHSLQPSQLKHYRHLSDFQHTGTKELVADDYIYQIKRLAVPKINSPIYGLMASKIVGLAELSQTLKSTSPANKSWLDLRRYPLTGVQQVNRYHYQVLIKGKYPQFIYWLAMFFFAPVPWQVDAFYSQPGMVQKNLTLDWYPVGTGPYVLAENNPNRRMMLTRNPYFHPDYFPSEGEPGDKERGYLNDAGKRLPFIDQVVFTLEKESIPRWNKFLQGYYDQSSISSDSFDQAIQINAQGEPYLTPELKKKGVYLQTSITQAISYIGFNMLDEVVGGSSERARKLRLAISIAVNYEQYINIFLNGRGVPAQGPLPPGIFGFESGEKGINPYVYAWQNNQTTRQPIAVAKRLMTEAGYPNGIDPKTGHPLILNYDVATSSGPDEKSVLAWLREQFAKLGIQLNIRNTEYNRFQEKIRTGEGQIFSWGWVVDYPDPENFLFLLYGPNSKVTSGGENATNYRNKAYDALFDQMKNMPNGSDRQKIIRKMLAILRHDSPWIWGIYQKDFVLNHVWVYPTKPNVMTYNTVKYSRINPILRYQLRKEWNRRVLWPLTLLALLLVLVSLPVLFKYWKKERTSVKN